MSETANRVEAIICDKLGLAPEQVTPEASFTTDLGADSLDTVEVKDAIDYIESHKG